MHPSDGVSSVDQAAADRALRRTAAVFAVAVVVHGADHLRRGIDAATGQVTGAGTLQFLLGAITVVLVFRRYPWAPAAAIAVGFTSAIGFTGAHLLPHWSAFSDPFTGHPVAPEVTAFSWASAFFEIGADVAFGVAGVRALRIHGRHDATAVGVS